MLSFVGMALAVICGLILGLKHAGFAAVAFNAALVAIVDAVLNWRSLKRSRLETRKEIWGGDSRVSLGYRAVVLLGYASIFVTALLIESIAWAAVGWLAR